MMIVRSRRRAGWARLAFLLGALALAVAACGGDSEVLQFPGPTPTPTVASQGD